MEQLLKKIQNLIEKKKEDRERELLEAQESAHSKEEAKHNIAEVKQRRALNSPHAPKKVVVEMKKSDLKEELMKRASKDPKFKKSLETIVNKALTTGGPAYATSLPGNMVNGQVMQTEEKVGHKKEKCKKCMKKR